MCSTTEMWCGNGVIDVGFYGYSDVSIGLTIGSFANEQCDPGLAGSCPTGQQCSSISCGCEDISDDGVCGSRYNGETVYLPSENVNYI